MIYFTTIFVFLILVLIFESSNNFKKNKFLYFLIYFFLVIFIGLRYWVGGDWGGYATDIAELNADLINSKLYELFYGLNFQPHQGYLLLLYFVSFFSTKIYMVNFIAAMIFCYGLIRLSIKQPYPLLSIYVGYCYFAVVYGMNFTKQSIALGFIMLILSINEKKIKTKIILFLIAFLFHYYSIIIAPFLFSKYFHALFEHLNKYKFHYLKKYLYGFILSIIFLLYLNFAILVLQIDYFDSFYKYIENTPVLGTIKGAFYTYILNSNYNHFSYSTTIRSSMMIFIFLIFLFFIENYKKFDDYYFNLYSLIFMLILFIMQFSANVAVMRILVYFSILHITIAGKVPIFFKTNSHRIISILFISFIYLIIFLFWFNFSPRNASFINYKNILFL